MWARILAGVVAAAAAVGTGVHLTLPDPGRRQIGPPQLALAAASIGMSASSSAITVREANEIDAVGLAACVGPAALPGPAHDRMAEKARP